MILGVYLIRDSENTLGLADRGKKNKKPADKQDEKVIINVR